jgi:hypothetical protein
MAEQDLRDLTLAVIAGPVAPLATWCYAPTCVGEGADGFRHDLA